MFRDGGRGGGIAGGVDIEGRVFSYVLLLSGFWFCVLVSG